MAVTGTITTKFIDEKGVDLGRQLVEKDYLISVYPNLVPQLKSAGLFVWGRNSSGGLGDNTITRRSSPVQTIASTTIWKQVSGGNNHMGAIKSDGTLWMWGFNQFAQLGDNSVVHRSSPVQTVAAGTNWQQLSCGYGHNGAIKTDGTLWMWGVGGNGALGDNTGIAKSSPVQTVTGGTNWNQIACGGSFTGAIKSDGTLWMWGYNQFGMLGNNSIAQVSSPVQTITGGTNWYQISCGYRLAAGIKKDGTLWCWGYNAQGQLGDNTVVDKSSPVQTITGGTNWKQVSCGFYFTAAIKTDGTLWMWGRNAYGELGINSLTFISSPVQTVTGGTNWKQVSCSRGGHVAALKTDGSLWLWGNANNGQIGNNNITPRSSPVQTTNTGITWKQVSAGDNMTTAILDFNY